MTGDAAARRPRSPRPQKPWSPRSRRLITALIDACERRDADAIGKLLRRTVELTIDSGGSIPIRNHARGRTDVISLLLNVIATFPRTRLTRGEINGQPGVIIVSAQQVVGILSASRRGGRLHRIWIVVNPEKLRHWNAD